MVRNTLESLDKTDRRIPNFLLHGLTGLSDVFRIHTSFVLSMVKYDTRIPIPEESV
ncbi:MAG: hypothetical protein BMS9Abin05_0944 [Rhodothermia bacterium]|nr:MAG: hypothetical protein BMS9Abin05_0944 [Rhodothermia bacterium]